MMHEKSWGDSVMLKTLSVFFGLRLTVVNAVTLTELRIRHDRALSKADLVFVFNGFNHYVPASTLSFNFCALSFDTCTLSPIYCTLL